MAGITTDKAVARLSFPKLFKLFNLNTTSLRQQLFTVVGKNAANHTTVISLPNANGDLEQYEVVEASNFEPDLQDRFPEIRAFSGKGITDKYATLKLSISPQGIQTMVFRTDKENEFIEPYSKDHTVYAVFKSQREKGKLAWTCSTDDKNTMDGLNLKADNTSSATGSSTGTLKTMRLAQSCNAEYSNYFGATSAAQVGLVLAAFNNTLTRCNGVYEKDLALHLNLISNTTSVIYYTASSDPYSTTLSQWNLQLQQTLTNVIGSANYDIGHMFGASGGGGNAGCIGCVCVNPATSNSLAKGAGITSPADGIPQGDNFDIDYVAHEVGHQLGGNHTFSMSSEGTGVNKEVGSGITIMGYAGITAQDVAPHSIDIFHQATIAQIQANLATKTCPVSTDITANNVAPVIAALSNYTIPISTPFALTGSASDANGDALTYCWEQNDNSTTTGAGSVAS
ncbi:MAG: reprolysin-like metallopeptidase, partial [Ferruginibacter sp.]